MSTSSPELCVSEALPSTGTDTSTRATATVAATRAADGAATATLPDTATAATAEPAAHTVQADRRARLVDWLLLVLPGAIWGASFLFIAEGLQVMAPAGVAFVRIAIGFATLSLMPGVWRPVARADRPAIALLGIVWAAFPISMFPIAEQHVSSALTGMLNGATPLFVAVVAGLIARRLPPRSTVLGLAVGLTGAVLIALPGWGQSADAATGVLLILAALASYGVAFNLARPLQQRNGALPVVWRTLGVALVLTAPLGLPALADAHWTPRAALSLLALGALGTGLAFVIAAAAAGRTGATSASGTTFLIPVVALLLGVVIRHEEVATIAILGCAICLLGAWLISARPTGAAPAASVSR